MCQNSKKKNIFVKTILRLFTFLTDVMKHCIGGQLGQTTSDFAPKLNSNNKSIFIKTILRIFIVFDGVYS